MATTRAALPRLICIYVLAGAALFGGPSHALAHADADTDAPESRPGGARAASDEAPNFADAARKFLLEGATDAEADAVELVKSVPYFRAAVPPRIFECLRRFPVLRCSKLFVLQKMEQHRGLPSSGDATRDFLAQLSGEEERAGSFVDGGLAGLPEAELDRRLARDLRRFFKHRDLLLHFLPGVVVRVVPSRENKLQFSLRTRVAAAGRAGRSRRRDDDSPEEISSLAEPDAEEHSKKGSGGGGHKKKKKQSYKQTILQMAVPAMVMPAILMGTFLPFLLPVLKMATFMTMMMNNSAFLAALIYAARTHANAQEEPQHINYGHQGYP